MRLLLDTDQVIDSCFEPPDSVQFASLWHALVEYRQSLPLCMLTRVLNNPVHVERAAEWMRERLQVSHVGRAAWRRRWAAVHARDISMRRGLADK